MTPSLRWQAPEDEELEAFRLDDDTAPASPKTGGSTSSGAGVGGGAGFSSPPVSSPTGPPGAYPTQAGDETLPAKLL